MKASACFALVLLGPFAARAQHSTFGDPWPTRGLVMPPLSSAVAQDATAPAYNPAALGFVEGAQLFYFHQAPLDFSQGADAGFLGLGVGALKGGFAVDWLRGGGLPDRRITSWTAAVGAPFAALGATWSFWQSSEDAQVDGWSTVDLGLTVRPARSLSLAGVLWGIGEPKLGARTIPLRWQVGLGLRPAGDWLTVAADLVGASGGYELFYTAAARLGGLVLSAGLVHPVGGGLPSFGAQGALDGPRFQVGLALDAEKVGVAYVQGVDPGAEVDTTATVGLRFSSKEFPSFTRKNKVYVIDVGRAVGGEGGLDLAGLLGQERLDPYSQLVLDLSRAARDPAAAAILLRMGHTPLSMGRAEELRGAIRAAQQNGRKVLVYLERADDAQYYAVAGADQVWAAPESTFVVNGLAAEYTFFGETLSKIGARVEYIRVGRYKTFPEQFALRGLSDAQSEVATSLLDDLDRRYRDALADGRGLDEKRLAAVLDAAVQSAARARELGLVDRALFPDQVPDAVTEILGDVSLAPLPSGWATARGAWGQRPRIALIRVEGTIAPGESQRDPWGGGTTGADTVAARVRSAVEDPLVKAIVVRVDSGGGDALASDLIWRELFRARARKPVIASMGSVAASGGYLVAVGADTVLAEPSTLTGSIGVFAVKLDLAGLYEKIGVNIDTVRRGPHADLFTTARGLTDAESERMQKWVDGLYDVFVERVAESRKLEKEQVDALGRGRVWTGRQARERRLVDGLGSLYDAVALARSRAGFERDEDVEVVAYGGAARGPFPSGALGLKPAAAVPPPLADLLRRAGAEALATGGGALAMLPFSIEVR